MSEVSKEAFEQSFDVRNEKLRQRDDADKHSLAIYQPAAFPEEMLQQYEWSPTARIHLRAYKLVKEGLNILYSSTSLMREELHLLLMDTWPENAILQAFPLIPISSHNILQLCKEILIKNPCFLEGLLLSYALRDYKGGNFQRNIQKVTTKHFYA